jgi:hypothetical protein
VPLCCQITPLCCRVGLSEDSLGEDLSGPLEDSVESEGTLLCGVRRADSLSILSPLRKSRPLSVPDGSLQTLSWEYRPATGSGGDLSGTPLLGIRLDRIRRESRLDSLLQFWLGTPSAESRLGTLQLLAGTPSAESQLETLRIPAGDSLGGILDGLLRPSLPWQESG